MAAILTLNTAAKSDFTRPMRSVFKKVFLAKNVNVNLDATLSELDIKGLSSDGQERVKEPNIDNNIRETEYRAYSDISQLEEKIMNFYLMPGSPVNKLILMDNINVVKAIITIPIITPDVTKTLYIPEIKISIL